MNKTKIGWPKAILGMIISFAILLIANILSTFVPDLLVKISVPEWIGWGIAAVLYPVLAYLGIKLFLGKLMKIPMEIMRLKKFNPGFIWLIVAILLPALVTGTYLLLPGEMIRNDLPKIELLTNLVFNLGIGSFGAAIVEEMVFRGVMMGLIENKSNRALGVIIPSVLFAAVHVIGSQMSILSFIQLLAGGTAVGVLFSLIAIYNDSIWNNALVHALWNGTQAIIMFTANESHTSLFSYRLKTDSFLITGGDFGIEASVISIAAYTLFIVFVLFLMKKNKTRGKKLQKSYSM